MNMDAGGYFIASAECHIDGAHTRCAGRAFLGTGPCLCPCHAAGPRCDDCGSRKGVRVEQDYRMDPETGYIGTRALCAACANQRSGHGGYDDA